jgi:hypothetical protein
MFLESCLLFPKFAKQRNTLKSAKSNSQYNLRQSWSPDNVFAFGGNGPLQSPLLLLYARSRCEISSEVKITDL